MFRRFLCWLGFHNWNADRELTLDDIWPMRSGYTTPTRYCVRCGKGQWWLPGYGGSEIGCWCPASEVRPRKPTPGAEKE